MLGCVLTSHAAPPVRHGIPLPTDWSHQHLIFTGQGSGGASDRASDDPRYLQQLYRRAQSLRLPEQIADGSVPFDATQSPGSFWSVDLGSGSHIAAGTYPAKFSFDSSTANCGSVLAPASPDYVVYSTGLAGSGTQAGIVAFDNLYSGCTGTVPSVYWAYNTSGGGSETVLTSPVISEDGSQVAFVQTNGAGAAELVLLKWLKSVSGSLAPPVTLTNTPLAGYKACGAPCMTTIALVGGGNPTDDTTSSVFYNYKTDVGWVADSKGYVHQFTNIFKGTPAEVTSPWPVQINPGSPTPATSAVYDRISTLVFVADKGGFLYSIDSTGTVTHSGRLDFGAGFVESPLVDAGNQLVYVFSSSDGASTCSGAATACAGVFQFDATFATNSTGFEIAAGGSVALGSATPPNPMYIGGVDSAYLNSSTATGNMYVCGSTARNPALYQIPFTTGHAASHTANLVLGLTSGSKLACSPVSDVQNQDLPGGTEERVFVSPQSNGEPTICTGTGCLINFIVTPWRPIVHWGLGQQVLNPQLDIETVIAGGNAGTTTPRWTTTQGSQVIDGNVTWLNQGHLTSIPQNGWASGHVYTANQRIIDTNNNIEIVTVAGTSGTTHPSWNTGIGKNTDDGTGTLVWINAGSNPTAALSVTGGTTGVIIDNTTTSTAGASQVYFGTLGDQTCTTSGGSGGCAVQASQPSLN